MSIFKRTLKLRISQIQYASPGFIDLVGFGKAFREMRKLLIQLVDRTLEAPDRELKREKGRVEIEAMKIKNLENLLKILDKAAIDHNERGAAKDLLLTRADLIRSMVENGKITRISQ